QALGSRNYNPYWFKNRLCLLRHRLLLRLRRLLIPSQGRFPPMRAFQNKVSVPMFRECQKLKAQVVVRAHRY
ncbi:MAG: hypothetical protein ACKPKO_25600, partial [Candidatus Fonsibacter sp.]